MFNDPSYVEIKSTLAGRNPATAVEIEQSEEGDPSIMLLTTLAETMRRHLNPLPPPSIPKMHYRLFKMQFQSLYHQRCQGDATRLSYLTGLLSDSVVQSVADSIQRHESYNLLWQRLDEEYGFVIVEAQTTLNNLPDVPELKSKDANAVSKFARQIHNALANSELASELNSQVALRAIASKQPKIANKLPKEMREKWS